MKGCFCSDESCLGTKSGVKTPRNGRKSRVKKVILN